MKKILLALMLGSGVSYSQVYISGNKGVLLRSKDRGSSWQNMNTGLIKDVIGLSHKDGDTIWFSTAGTGDNPPNASGLYRSNDAGATFELIGGTGIHPKSHIAQIGFFKGVNKNRGVVLNSFTTANPVSSILTTNNGLTWNATNSGGPFTGLVITDSTHGYRINGIRLEKTINAGQTWTEIYSPPVFRTVKKINSNAVIVAGEKGLAYRSPDGGTTWNQISTGTVQTINKIIASASGDTVIMMGNNGYLRRSTDGGINWSSVTMPVSVNYMDAVFASPSKVVIVGSPNSGSQTILRSEDGGLSFTRVPVDSIPGQSGSRTNISVDFSGPLAGWTATDSDGARVHRTNNGGLSWVQVTNLPIPNRNIQSIKVFAYDTVLIAYGGRFSPRDIYRTVDGGVNWVQVNTSNGENFSMYFPTGDTGYAVGSSGHIAKTVNGGVNWTNQSLDGSGDVFYGIDNGWIVGSNAKIFNTINYTSFSPLYPSGFAFGLLTGVHATHRDTVFICGQNGFVYQTNDGGLTWNYRGMPGFGNLKGITFLNSQKGFVYNNLGEVYKTDNSGNSWTKVLSAGVSVNAMAFSANPDSGTAVADNGRIFTTADGGATWNSVYSGTSENLNRVVYGLPVNEQNNVTPFSVNFGSQTFNASETKSVDVTVSDFVNVSSMGFGLTWDTSVVEFVSVGNFNLTGLTALKFNSSNATKGFITLDWSNASAVTVPDNQVIFTVSFKAKGANGAESALKTVSTLPSGGIKDNTTVNTIFTPGTLKIDIPSGIGSSPDLLSQVLIYPNPSTGRVNISKDGTYGIKVHDITGKEVMSSEEEGPAVLNIAGRGVYFITITSSSSSEVFKAVVQ